MTQPQDPRKHPLQDDEIALARVLRALAAGEPPASVDDAILRAATDAIAPGRRKPARGLRWLPTWAIGTAAAAVLAVGIGTQLRPPLTPTAAPASISEAVKSMPAARERLSVDLMEPDQPAALPPASAPPAPQRAARAAPLPPPPPPAAEAPLSMAAEPEAFPATTAAATDAESAGQRSVGQAATPIDAAAEPEGRVRSEASDQARRLHQEAYSRRAQAKADAGRQAAARDDAASAYGYNEIASPAPVASAAPSADTMADSAAKTAILPPVAEDASLAAKAWLERIRDRRRQGDTPGARASLRLFLKAHPEAPVPSDLAHLR